MRVVVVALAVLMAFACGGGGDMDAGSGGGGTGHTGGGGSATGGGATGGGSDTGGGAGGGGDMDAGSGGGAAMGGGSATGGGGAIGGGSATGGGGAMGGGSATGGGGMSEAWTLTLTVSPDAGGVIHTTSNFGNYDCPPDCTPGYPPSGATVTLHAAPNTPYSFSGWSGACSGTMDCTLNINMNLAATATFVRPNIAFIGRGSIVGTFGALTNADSVCNALAADAGLGGTFVAYLGTTGNPPQTRLTGSHGWVRPDGLPVVDQPDELIEGKLRTTLQVDQRGAFYNASGTVLVQTGAAADGGVGQNCNNWGGGTGATASGGSNRLAGSAWASNATTGLCTNANPIYCFETGGQLSPPTFSIPDGGRVAFVSNARFDGAATQAALDGECTLEAGRAMVAMRSRADAGSIAYVRLDAGTWYRPDGLKLYAQASDLNGTTQPLVPLNMLADGGIVTDSTLRAWTGGYPNLTSNGCQNWTTDAGIPQGTVGLVSDLTQTFNNVAASCAVQRPVYCFEP
jgi:hypothetical protein